MVGDLGQKNSTGDNPWRGILYGSFTFSLTQAHNCAHAYSKAQRNAKGQQNRSMRAGFGQSKDLRIDHGKGHDQVILYGQTALIGIVGKKLVPSEEAAVIIERSYHRNVIDDVLPAIQIVARSQFYLEYIVNSCSETKFKTTKSLVKMREMVHFATVEYTRSSLVRYDSLRELIEFIMRRQKNRVTPEQCAKIVDQFDSAVQFRASISTAKNEKYLSSVITLLTFIVSFSSIAAGVEYMNNALHIFPEESKAEYYFWVALLIIAVITVSAVVIYGIRKIVSLITRSKK